MYSPNCKDLKGGRRTEGYNRMTFSQNSETEEYAHLRQALDVDIPLDDVEAWSEFAGSTYDIAVPSDEELERDFDTIAPRYVEESLKTPLCDFKSLMSRLQNKIYEQHRQRIMDGKESFNRINDSLREIYSNESVAINNADLNDLLSRQDSSYSARFLIDVNKIVDAFELQDKGKKQTRQKAESHDSAAKFTTVRSNTHTTTDKLEKSFEIEMYDDQDEYQRKQTAKRPAPNPPQLSASMLAAAAKRRLKEVDTSESDTNDTPTIVISSVKSLATATQEVPTTAPAVPVSSPSKIKGLVPILPKPVNSSANPQSPTRSIGPGQQRQVLLAYMDGGELKLLNPGSLAGSPQIPYRLLVQGPSGSTTINGSPKGFPTPLQGRAGRPLILGSAGATLRPIDIRSLTNFTPNSRPFLNSKLVPLRLASQGPLANSNKLAEVPLQATPFRVTLNPNDSNDELSELSEKFSSSGPGGSSSFSGTTRNTVAPVEENTDKIIGF